MDADTQKAETLNLLHRTLQEYLEAVPRQKMPDAPDLMALFARLDALEKELTPSFPGELRHYMHQKSYRKAYLFLQGRDSENANGNCAR
jgi:hypothetical protein